MPSETGERGGRLVEYLNHGGVDDIGLHLLVAQASLAKPPTPPKERTEVTVDPKLFDGYVGQYQIAANMVLNVTREDSRLFAQAPGQPRFEIFPESERDYFLKAVDARITFDTDGDGRAVPVVLRQLGRDLKVMRTR